MATNDLKFSILVDTKTGVASIKGFEQVLEDTAKKARQSGKEINDSFSFSNLTVGLNQGLELLNKLSGVMLTPLRNAGQFEGYQTSLKVMLGSADAAQKRLAELVKFAAETPFELPQVIQAGNQLQAIGKYTEENLRMLGDLAAASGKPFEQVLSAYAKLATGQKGIAVDMFRDLLISQKDWVEATGKGVKASGEMEASAEEMLNSLSKVIQNKNFTGMMAEQSKTMLGQWSNLQDSIGQLTTKIGNELMPIAKSVMSIITPMFSFLQKNLSFIKPLLTGVAVGLGIFSLSMIKTSVSSGILSKSLAYLNKVIAANPIGAMALGVTALVTAMGILNDALVTTVEEQLESNKAQLDVLKIRQDSVKAMMNEKEGALKLQTEYKILASNKNRTAEETKRLTQVTLELNSKYPGLIKSGTDFTANLVAIEGQTGRTKNELRGLAGEYDNLTKQQKEMVKNLTKLDAQVAVQKVLDATNDSRMYQFFGNIFGELKNIKDESGLVELQIRKINEIGLFNLDVGKQKAVSIGILEVINQYRKLMEMDKEVAAQSSTEKIDTPIDKTIAEIRKKIEDYKSAAQSGKESIAKENETLAKEMIAKNKVLLQNTKNAITGENFYDILNAEFDPKKSKSIKGKISGEQDKFSDELTFWDTRYEQELIGYNQYIRGTDAMLEQINNNKEYVALSEKLKRNETLNGKEIAQYNKHLESIKKINDSRKKVNDGILKDYKEEAEKWKEETTKSFEKAESDLESFIIGANSSLESFSIKFDKNKINADEFISEIGKVITEIENKISSGGEVTKNLIEQLKMDGLDKVTIDEALKSLDISDAKQAALKKSLEKLTTIYEAAAEKRKKALESDITSIEFWKLRLEQVVGVVSENISRLFSEGIQNINFKNLLLSLKEGFKSVLLATIDYLNVKLVLKQVETMIDSIGTLGLSALKDLPLILAAATALGAARGLVSSFATGGLITQPTLALMGEAGTELVAPKQDFLTVARELIMQERKNIPQVVAQNNRVIFEVRNGAFKVAGRDLISQVEINQLYENKRYAY